MMNESQKCWCIALVVLVIVVAAVLVVKYLLSKKKADDVKEDFVYVPRSFYFANEYDQPGPGKGYGYSMGNMKVPLTDVLDDSQFMSRPSLKSYLSPRIPNIGFSSELRGPLPPDSMMSVPGQPWGEI